MALDERDLCAESGGAGGGDEPRGAATDHDEIIATRWFRIYPVWGMNVRMKPAIVFIPRLERRSLDHEFQAMAAGWVRFARAARARRVITIVTASVATNPTP